MVRAQFLIGIVFPLTIGTLISVLITGSLRVWNFILVLIIGLGLHLATDVYNDIYDTLQGADTPSSNTRNVMSGGSGLLLQHPDLLPQLYRIARFGLVLSFVALIALFLLFTIELLLWPFIIFIYAAAAFLSKYYTAAPIKLGYRGYGEILIWLSFGPMAIFLAALSQNIGYDPLYFSVMSITGFSTLTILWIGQLIDFEDDQQAGKQGMAIRLGKKRAIAGYMIIQLCIIINIIILGLFVFHPGWPLLFSLIPYAVLFPRISKRLTRTYDNASMLCPVGWWNALLYGTFNLVLILGLATIVGLKIL